MTPRAAFIIRYRQLRDEKKLTNAEVCYNAGISKASLENVLHRNGNYPGLNLISNVCLGLDISVREFFNDDVFNELSYK